MNNVLPRAMKMHYKYDLKGSSYKRRASRKERAKSSPTFKDLDFKDMHVGLHLNSDTYNALMKTLQRDCRVGSRNRFSDTQHIILFNISVSKFAQVSLNYKISSVRFHTVNMDISL